MSSGCAQMWAPLILKLNPELITCEMASVAWDFDRDKTRWEYIFPEPLLK